MGRLSRQLLWALPLVFLTGTLQQTTLRHKLKLDSVDADALSVAGSLTVGTPIAPQYLGTGALSVDVFLRGDGVWAEPPPQFVTSFMSSSAFASNGTVTVGPALTVTRTTETINLTAIGAVRGESSQGWIRPVRYSNCRLTIRNITTDRFIDSASTSVNYPGAFSGTAVDTMPVVGDNIYQMTMTATDGNQADNCWYSGGGLIAFFT